MHHPHVLPEVAVLFAADVAGQPELVVHVQDVPLQVRLEVARVPAVGALVVFYLKDNQEL